MDVRPTTGAKVRRPQIHQRPRRGESTGQITKMYDVRVKLFPLVILVMKVFRRKADGKVVQLMSICRHKPRWANELF